MFANPVFINPGRYVFMGKKKQINDRFQYFASSLYSYS